MIPLSFYLQEDVVAVAKDLLGKTLYSCIDGVLTGGIITETEAYAGVSDRASHAYGGRRTKRNEAMYKEGGIAYVYLCYGIHHLLNIVTNKSGVPHAVLIRALLPTHGVEEIQKRRKSQKEGAFLCSGPGTVTQALGIDLTHNHLSLFSKELWLTDGPRPIEIVAGPRVGVEYAKEDALLPYRFRTIA